MKLEISIVLFDTWNGKCFDGMGQFSVNYDFIQAVISRNKRFWKCGRELKRKKERTKIFNCPCSLYLQIYVEFCDFGFEAQLEYNDIRDLEPNFLLLPFQVIVVEFTSSYFKLKS